MSKRNEPRLIEFCDLRRAVEPIRQEIDKAINQVIESGWFLRGQQVAAFEDEWAEYCGQDYCVTCNSGTDALTLAAMACGITDAEIQANTLSLTAVGLSRAFVKIKVQEIDTDGRLEKFSRHSIPVLLYGRAPSLAEAGATLFDAAHAHGWKPPQQAVACWSFYPTKSLGAFGDGGAVTTNDANLAAEMRQLSGRDDKFYQSRQITSRMDEVQAAVLRIKLQHLDDWIDERRRIATRYTRDLPKSVKPICTSERDLQHIFVVRSPNRDALAAHLLNAGIATKVHFPVPLHRQAADWQEPAGKFPIANQWCDTVLSLPCYPGLTDGEIDRVCMEIRRFHQQYS
jgi:dTDP-4-amino-4,6-dideoxygalactose transaminase